MLKKLLVGLFILGLMCGAGFISAGQYSTERIAPSGSDTPSYSKSILCNGGNC